MCECVCARALCTSKTDCIFLVLYLTVFFSHFLISKQLYFIVILLPALIRVGYICDHLFHILKFTY